MKIVLNTSPIIFLSKINCLHLLEHCVKQVFVPKNVVRELGDVTLPPFIKIESLSVIGSAYLKGAIGRLHEGELSAIVLAQELAADFVILDDLLARQKAQRLGLNVMGTIGLLLLMEKQQRLSNHEIWQLIAKLTQRHGMYLSNTVLLQLREKLFAK